MSIDKENKSTKDIIDYLLERNLFGDKDVTKGEIKFLKAVSDKTIKISFR